jgi:deoxycytidylate deaminase
MSHAERNTIFLCARKGYATEGTTMFTQGLPCCDCADGVIQAGIVEVVIHKQWGDYEQQLDWQKWVDSATRSKIKFEESGIKARVFDGLINMDGYLDGKIINV